MKCGYKLRNLIFLERRLQDQSTEQKSLNLDQDSRRNHRMNKKEIFEKLNRGKPKLKLKLTQLTIRYWNLKLYKGILGCKTIPNPWFKAFHSRIRNTRSLMFKSRFRPILSTKSHFQALRGRDNESRTAGRKRFTGFFCLNSSITRIALLYNVEEHLYL